jgi:hypothetical protein
MSWNNTVRCGHCFATGHNKRTCPTLTEAYKSRAEAEVAGGEGREGYWVRQYAKRVGVWLDNGEEAVELKKTRRGSVRRCSYCNKVGHNARTCPELKEAKTTYLREAMIARKIVFREIQKLGIGIGSLVKGEHYGTPVVYMVAQHNWAGLNHESVKAGSQFMKLQLLTGGSQADSWHRERWQELPQLQELPENLEQRSYAYRLEVVGPVANGLVPPAGWFDCEDIDEKEIFKDRKSPDFHDNRWND